MFEHNTDRNSSLLIEIIAAHIERELELLSELSGDANVLLHSLETALMVGVLTERMGLSLILLRDIVIGALGHDYSKILEDYQSLVKGEILFDSQKGQEIRRQHPVKSAHWLYILNFPHASQKIAYMHHEFKEGNGYPDGKTDIPFIVTLVATVDYLSSLTRNGNNAKNTLSFYEAFIFMYNQVLPPFPEIQSVFENTYGQLEAAFIRAHVLAAKYAPLLEQDQLLLGFVSSPGQKGSLEHVLSPNYGLQQHQDARQLPSGIYVPIY